MPADTYQCPECHTSLRSSPGIEAGDLVQCPKCQTRFTIPERDAAPTPRESPPFGSEITETPGPSRPKFSEVEDDPLVTDRPRRPSLPEPQWGDDDDYPRPSRLLLDPEDLSREWSVDMSKWFEHATSQYSAILWPSVGFGLVFFLIYLAVSIVSGIVGMIVPFGGNVVQLFVLPPLQAGWLVVALAQLKREEWSFGDFFGGFRQYWPLVAVQLIIYAISLGLMLPVGVTVGVIAVGNGPPELAVGVALVIGLPCVCALIYLLTRATFFANQVILDRGYGPIEAVKASWNLSRGHFWGLFGVSLLLGLIMFGGILLCGVGALFAMPLVCLVQAAAYLTVAGTRRPQLWTEN